MYQHYSFMSVWSVDVLTHRITSAVSIHSLMFGKYLYADQLKVFKDGFKCLTTHTVLSLHSCGDVDGGDCSDEE